MTEKFNPEDYWQTRLAEKFNLEGVGFTSLGKGFNFWMYRVRRYQFLRKLRKLKRDFSQAQILDIGSGTGFYIERWQNLGVQSITGADITNVVVDNLSTRFPNHAFHKVDITDEDVSALLNQSYDMISCIDVLFHIVDDERYTQAFENIYQLLKHDGIFIFSENFVHGEEIRYPHHVSRPLGTIQDQVTNAGFEVICRVPMFYFMNTPVDTTNRIHHGIWRRISKWASKSTFLGFLLGICLYPFELILITFLKEGPTTELMICKKI